MEEKKVLRTKKKIDVKAEAAEKIAAASVLTDASATEKKQEEKKPEIKAVQKGDFVELNYTGRVKEGDFIFDTTEASVARENNILNQNLKYEPVVVCIGEQNVLKGLDSQLEGKELGKRYTAAISPEDGFGRRNAKLIQLISLSKFKSQDIAPFPGLQVNVDGIFGVVKSVSGGRVLVDFNHPLAGKELVYTFTINRIVIDELEKLKSVVKMFISEFEASLNEAKDAALIAARQEIPKEVREKISGYAKKTLPSIKDIEFALSQ